MPERAPRFQIVQLMRGAAAVSVAWFHLTNTYPTDSLVRQSGSYGWLGVDIFFVVSGFIIPYSIAREVPNFSLRDGPRFLLRRIVRLEPPYILSIALVIALVYLSALSPAFQGTIPVFQMGEFLSNVMYAVPFTGYRWLQPVYWTLAYEFVFYLCCSFAYGIVAHRIVLFFLSVVCAVALITSVGLPPITLLFVMGLAAFRLTVLHDPPWAFAGALAGSAAVMTCAGYGLEAVAGIGAALLIAATRDRRLASGWVGSVFMGLGTVSYSLYLAHIPIGGRVVNLGKRFLDGDLAFFALSVAALLIALAFAGMFWWVVERPAIAASRLIRIGPRVATR